MHDFKPFSWLKPTSAAPGTDPTMNSLESLNKWPTAMVSLLASMTAFFDEATQELRYRNEWTRKNRRD